MIISRDMHKRSLLTSNLAWFITDMDIKTWQQHAGFYKLISYIKLSLRLLPPSALENCFCFAIDYYSSIIVDFSCEASYLQILPMVAKCINNWTEFVDGVISTEFTTKVKHIWTPCIIWCSYIWTQAVDTGQCHWVTSFYKK